MTYSQAYEKLSKYGQEHVLKYYDGLNDAEKGALLAQIEKTDLTFLASSLETDSPRGKIEPMGAMQLPEITEKKDIFEKAGIEAIKAGKVGAVLLAGGMGTRLGSDKPKGMFDIGVTKPLYIFECLINNLMRVVKKCGVYVRLYVMTSDKNDKDTREFFKEKNYFGYNPEYIKFFEQKMAPATDRNGKIYLESKCSMALSPNGNGGWFSSMADAGLLPDIKEHGIEWLNVFAVDNVLQKMADPLFVGATVMSGCQVGAKVIRKNARDEKVGVMCLEDSRPSIVEYYELTDEMMDLADENGDRVYNFGVILNYLFNERALEKIVSEKLPLHRVEKKIAYMNDSLELVKPTEPNGYKYENLVLDMIHMLDSCLPFEVVREHEFAPIKNKEGKDSVVSARALLEQNSVIL